MMLNFCKIRFDEVRGGRSIWVPWDRYMVIWHVVRCKILLNHKNVEGKHHHVHMFIYKYLSLNIYPKSGQVLDSTYEWKKTKICSSLKGDLLTVEIWYIPISMNRCHDGGLTQAIFIILRLRKYIKSLA